MLSGNEWRTLTAEAVRALTPQWVVVPVPQGTTEETAITSAQRAGIWADMARRPDVTWIGVDEIALMSGSHRFLEAVAAGQMKMWPSTLPAGSEKERASDLLWGRFFLVLLCGIALGLSGAVSQSLFRNALASPSILGIESAGLLALTLTMAWAGQLLRTHINLIPVVILAGALLGAAMITASLGRFTNSHSLTRILIVGLAANTIFGSLQLLTTTFLFDDWRDEFYQSMAFWKF